MPPSSCFADEEEDDLAYPWDEGGAEIAADAAECNTEQGDYPDEECAQEEEALEWDGDALEGGDDLEAAAADVETDLAFESLNATHDAENDGRHERAILAKMRKDLALLFRPKKVELEAFGSYVTNLGLPNSDGSGKSDLDVVLLFHSSRADDVQEKSVRESLVLPTIERLGDWCRKRPEMQVKAVIKGARVPIVTTQTRELELDISVQQPWGVLNSWHLRDLCDSGRPGRLRLLVRLVKTWAKSKSIHTAKDGGLSSYGYSLLSAGYLRECGALQALLPLDSDASNKSSPYLDSNTALDHVLKTCQKAVGADAIRRADLWREPEPVSGGTSLEGDAAPQDLFAGFIEWLAGTVLSFAGADSDLPLGCGALPLAQRHIVSVRDRSQQALRADISWSAKRFEHWSPSKQEVFMLVEEPLSGENVGRSVRKDGFQAIRAEVKRASEFFAERLAEGAVEDGDGDGLSLFRELCYQEPLTTRAQPWSGGGGGGGPRNGGWKRPLEHAGEDEPWRKRPAWTGPQVQQRTWSPGVAPPQKTGAFQQRPFAGRAPMGFRARAVGPGAGLAMPPGYPPASIGAAGKAKGKGATPRPWT